MGSSSSKNTKKKKEEYSRNDYIPEGYIPEKKIENMANELSGEDTQKILSQMEVSICKILNKDGSGTGFFCTISIDKSSEEFKALITNNHVLNIEDIAPNKKIKITINNSYFSNIIVIDSKRRVYTSAEYDITIIELRESDNLQKVNFLKIDEKKIKTIKVISSFDNTDNFEKEEVYILQYPGGLKAKYSVGIIECIVDEYNIQHLCSTKPGSSGSPILSLSSFKILGIHKGCHPKLDYNLGTFIKNPLDEFRDFHKQGILGNYSALKNKVKNGTKKIKIKTNEIIIKLKVEKKDIKKKIYFLGNFNDIENLINKNKIEKDGYYLKEINKSKTEIFIENDKIKEFNIYFIPEYEKDYEIKIKFNYNMNNCSYMFFNCPNIIKIDLSNFITTSVTNMNHMFGRCYNVKEIELNNFNTDEVIDMSYMFSKCKNLLYIDLSNFETDKVRNMSCMFNECLVITNIYIYFFNTEKVTDMSGMFLNCNQLEKLNLNSFNTKNVIDMNYMFQNCFSLKELITDKNNFNTENVKKMCNMFKGCNNLNNLNLSLNTKKANLISFMFENCYNLEALDLSKFNTKNVKNMSKIFKSCKKLSTIDISTFSFENIKENQMTNMFDECDSLTTIKINKNWKQKIESTNDILNNIEIIY